MKLRYLIVDNQNQLKLIRRDEVEAVWRGQVPASEIGCTDLTELRLVSVVCDNDTLPERIYLLRIALTDGHSVGLQDRLPRVRSLLEIAWILPGQHVVKRCGHRPYVHLGTGIAVVDELLPRHE